MEEGGDFAVELCLGLVEIVVDDDTVEVRCVLHLGCGFGYSLLYFLGAVGCATDKAFAQFVHRGRSHKERLGTVAKDTLEVDTAFDIDIEDDMMSCVLNAFYLALESAIVGAGIDLLPFDQFVFGNELFKLGIGDEIVLSAVLLLSAWCAGGSRDRELEVVSL